MALLAPTLVEQRHAIQRSPLWPRRSRGSDGWIGDDAHKRSGPPEKGGSDHNVNKRGLVNAIDSDTRGGHGPTIVAAAIVCPGTEYVIYRGRIYRRADRFRPRVYTGSNRHTNHAHQSIGQTTAAEQAGTGSAALLVTHGPDCWVGPNRPYLRQGVQHAALHVRQLQAYLNAQGASLVVDGAFGPATDRAVRAFQRASRAAGGVDGIVGPGTRRALRTADLVK